jgi:hypothetical protein
MDCYIGRPVNRKIHTKKLYGVGMRKFADSRAPGLRRAGFCKKARETAGNMTARVVFSGRRVQTGKLQGCSS